MDAPLGHCYWAVAPFAPSPPFEIYQKAAPPHEVPTAAPFTEAVKKGESEFKLLTTVKVRPVLVMTRVLPEHEEVLALRLRRLEKLASEGARQVVRDGKDEALFYLTPGEIPRASGGKRCDCHLAAAAADWRPGPPGEPRLLERQRATCGTRARGSRA